MLKPFSKLYATDYMACTEHAGRWLFGNKTYNDGKVYLLNNAIDLNKFKYDEKLRMKKRKEFNIDDNTLVIGHIGRFVAQKNHTFLIDIFNEIHKNEENSILLLAGQGPLIEEIENKVESLGLNDSVKFLGQRNDVNELYQAFDIFLLPSLYEGLGMVLIEAQAASCPCVCSTEVPQIAKLTPLLEFVNLNDNIESWTKKVNSLLRNERRNCIQEIINNGYDINTETIKLEQKYLALSEKQDI